MSETANGTSPSGMGADAAVQTQEILKARARALARPANPPAQTRDTLEVVEFRLAKERYAFERGQVREVQPLKDLTPLPGTPAFLRGVINLRGQILPVIDIKRFFDLPEEGITDLHVVVVVQAAGIEVGILADAVFGVHSIELPSLEASLPTLTGIRADYLKGVTGDRLVILDAARMLGDPSIVVDDDVR